MLLNLTYPNLLERNLFFNLQGELIHDGGGTRGRCPGNRRGRAWATNRQPKKNTFRPSEPNGWIIRIATLRGALGIEVVICDDNLLVIFKIAKMECLNNYWNNSRNFEKNMFFLAQTILTTWCRIPAMGGGRWACGA